MKRAVRFISCNYLFACLMAGCSEPSASMVADELPISSDARADLPAFVDGNPDTESLDVFTERVHTAPPWVQAILDQEAQTDFDEATLSEIVASLGKKELYVIPIGIVQRPLAIVDFDLTQQLSIQLNGISLRLGLQRLLQPHGLVCDYRFEQFVITTTQDARSWTEQTGVRELKPSPGSRWASILDDETGVECYNVMDLAEQLKIHYGVEVKLNMATRDSPQRGLFEIHTARAPNRHWLRILLGRQNLTCRLDGETLVIESLGE